jgi:hypothetical protein
LVESLYGRARGNRDISGGAIQTHTYSHGIGLNGYRSEFCPPAQLFSLSSPESKENFPQFAMFKAGVADKLAPQYANIA